MISSKKALDVAKKFHINLRVVPLHEFKQGLNIELEHGSKLGKLTNITNDNIDKTAKIVIAHLEEDPRYYRYLKQLERTREHFWKKRYKPSIFINNYH